LPAKASIRLTKTSIMIIIFDKTYYYGLSIWFYCGLVYIKNLPSNCHYLIWSSKWSL
jgi:hypothetical protein